MLKILHARLQQSWSRAWQPTPVLLPGESPGQRDLVGYSTWGHKELDTTEQQSTTQHKLQQYVNWKLTDVQAGFRKVRGTRDQIVNIHWIIEKGREFQKKKSPSASPTMLKPVTLWITTNCGKFLKTWVYQTTFPASWETCMQAKKKQVEPDMEQLTGSKLGKEYIKVLHYHSAYLTYLQSTWWKLLGWMKHKLESRLPEKYQ